mmetsp:Transcript_97910/g.282469  ORF Transcript_97910/g.282469 Transcript_97910/m.282469 type:complete len:271 (-) Transcript_97910:207-1019(-)
MSPSWKTSNAKASTRGRARASRSVPGGRRSTSVIFQPSINAMVSTRRPQYSGSGRTQPMFRPLRSNAVDACEAFMASILKSTSSREARLHSLMRSVASGASGWYFAARLQMNSTVARSVPTMLATPRCCTFTQTLCPDALRWATWACATLAEAIGRSLKSRKICSRGRPRSARMVCRTSRREEMGSSSWRPRSSSTHAGGNSPVLIEAACPTFVRNPRYRKMWRWVTRAFSRCKAAQRAWRSSSSIQGVSCNSFSNFLTVRLILRAKSSV